MSRENVESMRRAVEAFNRGDAAAFVALGTPDVEWEDAIFWSEGSRIYRGRDELRDWFAQVREPWERIQIAIEEIIETGHDRLVFGLRLTARGSSSGADTRLEVWQVQWFREGLTAKRRIFRDRAEALEAARLSE
jgi:ketosteroid isomerase-like protein